MNNPISKRAPASLHPCKPCRFAKSVQGYRNVCDKPEQVARYKAFYYIEINRQTCGELYE